MRNKSAFTIIEVLIALSLSSIIIFGMMQTYNNVMRYLGTVQDLQNANRKVCLLFNQLERDFSTAFIPPLLELEKTANEEEANKKETPKETAETKTPEEKAREDAKEREKFKIYFMANTDENELAKKINDQRCYPFKSVSFINTNPLQIYDQQRCRVVRISYELVLDKPRSKGDNLCYNLYRKETENLENFKLKVNEFENNQSKKDVVRKHLVADGIKSMFVQYVYQGYKKDKKEIEELILDSWGEKKETVGILPSRIEVTISFWNNDLSKNVTYQTTVPIYAFSLIQEKKEEKKKEEKKSGDLSQEQATKPPEQPPSPPDPFNNATPSTPNS